MDNNKSTVRRPNHRLRPMRERGRFFITRQWLNSIFMLGALIGGIFYFATDDTNIITYKKWIIIKVQYADPITD